MTCTQKIISVGQNPTNLQWKIVRGNTSTIRIEFLNNDESTPWDTTGWTYVSTAYDQINDTSDELDVFDGGTYVDITAPAEITSNWGIKYGNIVGEVPFDLQISFISNGSNIVWTPIVGTICLLGDVTTGSSL